MTIVLVTGANGFVCRALAESKFGIEKIVDTHLIIYQELLDAC